jgi:hypothetical protein
MSSSYLRRALDVRRWTALVAALVLVLSGAALADLALNEPGGRAAGAPSSATLEGHESLVGRLTGTPTAVLLGKRGGDRGYQPAPAAGLLPTRAGQVEGASWLVTPAERGAATGAVRAERGRAPPARSS